ncbi:MAG: AAA family ATPase [Deltaproteobacteria bacterium]|jgi:hypothetical protein|nr:AAA family ATPase [Deltaproteobacteria bacterium]
MTAQRILPLGYVNFADLRRDNCIYADNTRLVYELIKSHTPFFLSRPHRFGKTLLVSVLKAALEGRKDLFEGLWIYDQEYDWEPHPTISLSLASDASATPEELRENLSQMAISIARKEKMTLKPGAPGSLFMALIRKLYRKYGKRVAILIDDYDIPIINHLNNLDLAHKMGRALDSFYSVIKACEDERDFIFMTGESGFLKTSFFNRLNNLTDISFHDECVNILGFTVAEFDRLFEARMEETLNEFARAKRYPEIRNIGDLKSKILKWYGGYSWDGKTVLLNPWSVLSFFRKQDFDCFWPDPDRPGFLEKMISAGQAKIPDLFNRYQFSYNANILKMDDNFNLSALLFQTGYLSIAQMESSYCEYRYLLDFPNFEVRTSITQISLSLKRPIEETLYLTKRGKTLLDTLSERDAERFRLVFRSFIKNFPSRNIINDENFEYLAFILAVTFSGHLCEPQVENGGEVKDLQFRSFCGDDYVVEIQRVSLPPTEDNCRYGQKIKLMEDALNTAFKQIDLKKHHFRFQESGHKIYKTALVFAGRSEILVDFREASDWRLEWDKYSNAYAVPFTVK